MRIPLSWLRDFAPLSAPASDLAAALSGLGLVVEGMESFGEGLGDVIVARVLATRPDQLRDHQVIERGDGIEAAAAIAAADHPRACQRAVSRVARACRAPGTAPPWF